MHIPDSALSPATSLAAGVAMLPVWAASARHTQRTLSTRQAPLLALGASFCFTIMMFNVPAPGGTTVHPVGGVLLAALLGPWAAVIGVTAALAIQALFFGDGGLLTLGANCFSMAFAMPLAGYAVYRLAAGRSASGSPRRALAAGIGAYAGINAAALITAILLGIQPALFHGADGRALFFPFGLRVTLPAIMLPHLLIAGVAEGVVTTLAVRYLQAAGFPLHATERGSGVGRLELLWVALGALAALTPVGLLARGDAWGEWSAEQTAKRIGYAPAGAATADARLWHGFNLLPDYLSERGPAFYLLSAVAGIALAAGLAFALRRLLAYKRRPSTPVLSATTPDGSLPSWLVEPNATAPMRPTGRTPLSAPSRRYAERTLAAIVAAAKESLLLEECARRDGLMQRLDPRVKLIGLLGMALLAALLRHAAALAALLALAAGLAALSRLPARRFAGRVGGPMLLFGGLVAAPMMLGVVNPGPAAWIVSRSPDITVTWTGMAAACVYLLRLAAALSFATLLTLTTPWQELLRALRVLLLPRIMVTVLAICYRYLAVLAQAASDTFAALTSRSVGRARAADGRSSTAGIIGALFGRTIGLTDEVHAAMLARGYTGEPRGFRPLRARARDYAWLASVCVAAAAVLIGDRLG